mmetsp:Transcript_15425/g.33409  ORF Transcript_15425/g.33409 Transcript_15425/m.33409 type:complete len:97 (+) Transcript_15425:57-347(+)
MPPGFNPNLYFGDENDEDEDDQIECDDQLHHQPCQQQQQQQQQIMPIENGKETIQSGEVTNVKLRQTPKLLSWEEKQRLLYQIYDEEEIPAELSHE